MPLQRAVLQLAVCLYLESEGGRCRMLFRGDGMLLNVSPELKLEGKLKRLLGCLERPGCHRLRRPEGQRIRVDTTSERFNYLALLSVWG